MRAIDKIIIHCSATREGADYSVKDIDAWHKSKGWKGCGYHYVIKLDGTIQAGRPEEQIGAHTSGQNAHSIGVCYIGGLDSFGKSKDTRTPQQRASLLSLLRMLHRRFPKATVHGHREFAAKDCPCFDVRLDKDIQAIFKNLS